MDVPLRTDCTYTDPDIVADMMDFPDPHDPTATMRFTNESHPSYNAIVRMIRSNEDIIDRRLKRSWRVNYVKDHVCDIPVWQHDESHTFFRPDYYKYGGNVVQLNRDILPWDPTEGDKLEIRQFPNHWVDISTMETNGGIMANTFSFDYDGGKLILRSPFFTMKGLGLRISYRYGSTDPVPDAITRLCTLMTASQLLTQSFWIVKVGMGGDISGIKEQMLREWKEEMNTIWSSFQRSGSVYSLISR